MSSTMRAQRLIAFVAVALILAAVSACGSSSGPVVVTGGGGDGERIRVGFVSNNAAEFWTIAEAGTRKAAEDFGVEVLFRRPNVPTAAAQKEIIEDLLA